jgi:general secretion pathway protein N
VFRNVSSSLRPRQRLAATAAPRSPWGWAAAGVLVGVLPAVISFAPAQWLARAVDSATGGQVLLAQARGTVWTGSAQLVLTGGGASQDRAALPGRLEWQLRPTLRGLRAQVHAACCMTAPLQARLDARWGGARLALADGQSQLARQAVLAGLGTPWNTLQPQGQLALQTQGLAKADWAAGRMVLTGTAQLDALAMSSRLSTLRPMGSYRLVLQGGDVPTLTLGTLDGASAAQRQRPMGGPAPAFHGRGQCRARARGAPWPILLNIIGRRNGARSLITAGLTL